MPGPHDPSGQVEDGVEVDDARGRATGDEAQDHEHHGDEHGGEQLEEALDPQVDDPEAPVVDHGEVGAGAEEERGQVEERDRRRRVEEERGQLGALAVADRRPQRPVHEHEPAREADRQQELPEAAEVQVLRALVAEPEPQAAEAVVEAQPLAAEAAEDDDGEGREQREHTRALPAGLGAADDRREEEAAGHPGGGDPEDGELEVEGSQEVVGKKVRQVDPVERPRLDTIVGERAPGERLEQEQQRDDAEVEADRLLAGRQGPAGDRAVVRVPARRAVPAEVVEAAEGEQDGPESREQRDEAERAPEIGGGARPVADGRLVGPVVGVGVVLARAIGDGRPRRPREVRGEGPELARIADVLRGKTRRGLRSREVLGPFARLYQPGRRFGRREDERAGAGIVAVLLQQAMDGGVDARGRVGIERRVGESAPLASERVLRDGGEPVQVLCAEVGAEVRAVAPERAVLHQAVLEEDLLPVLDVFPREEGGASGVCHSRGNGRSVRVGEDGDQREHAVGESAPLASQRVLRDGGEPVQVLRAEIRAEVRSVAPERAVLHQAVLEEDLLPVLDVLLREEGGASGVCHSGGNGRSVRVGEDGDQREHAEPEDHHQDDGVTPPRRERLLRRVGRHLGHLSI